MASTLLAIPILGIAVIIQTTVITRLPLIHGSADLVLLTLIAWALQEKASNAWQWALIGGLMITYVTAVPVGVYLLGYLLVTLISRLLQRQIWQTPILAMFGMTFIGTMILHSLTIASLIFRGASISVQQSLQMVTLPSALLNLLLAVPIYALVRDFNGRLYPSEFEV